MLFKYSYQYPYFLTFYAEQLMAPWGFRLRLALTLAFVAPRFQGADLGSMLVPFIDSGAQRRYYLWT